MRRGVPLWLHPDGGRGLRAAPGPSLRPRPAPRALGLALGLVLLTGFTLPQGLIEQVRREHGDTAAGRLEAWQGLAESLQGRPERERVAAVNDFFNRARFRGDPELHGERDYWATPVEFLTLNAGDCEDYSIAKYFTLAALGVPDERLRITYVKADTPGGELAHMVLAYYPSPDADPVILDNLRPELVPASRRGDLTPVYSFNGEGLWRSVERGRGRPVAGGAGRIDLWKGLLRRVQRELGGRQ